MRGHASAVTTSGLATVADVTGDAEARSDYGDVTVHGAGTAQAGTLEDRTTSSGWNTTWSRTGLPSASRDSSRSAAR